MLDRLLRRNEVLIAGHHGMGGRYPDNTLLSFKEALDAKVDMLILDLRSLSDGAIVIMHDAAADQTTDGSGEIAAMTLEQVKALDAGIQFGKQFEGLRVPTLQEVCTLAEEYKDLILTLEIRDAKRETVDTAVAIMREYGMLKRCIFSCFDAEILFYIQEEYDLPTQTFLEEDMANFKKGIAGTYANCLAVAIGAEQLSRSLVREFERQRVLPWCFCLEGDEQVEKALRCGARLLICNDPRPALKIVAKWRLHPHMLQGPACPAWKWEQTV